MDAKRPSVELNRNSYYNSINNVNRKKSPKHDKNHYAKPRTNMTADSIYKLFFGHLIICLSISCDVYLSVWDAYLKWNIGLHTRDNQI